MSCGFCAPFQMAVEEDELELAVADKELTLNTDANVSPRMGGASPGLESIPEGFKETSEDAEDKNPEESANEEGEAREEGPAEEEEEEIIKDFDDGATELYFAIQNKDWEKVVTRLEEAPEESKVWVTRKDPVSGTSRWKILPLHASIIFVAPDSVVEALLKAYPNGPKKQDDQGMTPLHLAFRLGAAESVVSLILQAYPEAKEVEDKKGRTPLILAQTCKGANKAAFLRVLTDGPRPSTAEIEAKLKFIMEEKEEEIEQVRKQADEKQADLRKEIDALQIALVRNKETSQVLVDHITLLETDHKVKEEDMAALIQLRAEKDELEVKINNLREEELNVIKLQERDQLEEDCKILREDIRILKEQLTKRTANETALAGQVASLAQQLSLASTENTDSANQFATRIQNLEEERKNMRSSVHVLTRKLFTVGTIIKDMGKDQDRMIEQAKRQEEQIQKSTQALTSIMEQLQLQNDWIKLAMVEREALRSSVERQETAMHENQKVRDEIFAAAVSHGEELAAAGAENKIFLESITSVQDTLSNVMQDELKQLPEESAFSDPDELVDQVLDCVMPTEESVKEQPAIEDEEAVEEEVVEEEEADVTEEEAGEETVEEEAPASEEEAAPMTKQEIIMDEFVEEKKEEIEAEVY